MEALWSILTENWRALLAGTWLTIQLVVISAIVGFLLAVPLALARLSRNPLLSGAATGYSLFFRGTPLLVQIFIIYYGLAQFEWVRASPLWTVLRQPYWCAILAFALNTGAYTGEITYARAVQSSTGGWGVELGFVTDAGQKAKYAAGKRKFAFHGWHQRTYGSDRRSQIDRNKDDA